MSLLSMIQNAARRLSIPVPSVVVASSDIQVLQLLQCAQDEGRSLASRHLWQALTTEKTFTTVAAAAQTNAIPSDFDRIVPETMYNRTRTRRVWGPVSNDEWQEYQATLAARVDPAFRIRGSSLLITPTPTAGDTVAYEYISKNWCQTSGGTGQSAWAADTDTGVLDEPLMTLGVIWRFRADKGLDYANSQSEYERRVADAILNDGARPRLGMDARPQQFKPTAPTVPDTLVFS